VLRAQIDSPTYSARYFDPRGTQDLFFPLPEVPYLKAAAVHDETAGVLTLFALNRHLDEQMTLRVDAQGFAGFEIEQAHQLRDADLDAVNTKAQPDRVRPTGLPSVQATRTGIEAVLSPASWNVVRVKVAS